MLKTSLAFFFHSTGKNGTTLPVCPFYSDLFVRAALISIGFDCQLSWTYACIVSSSIVSSCCWKYLCSPKILLVRETLLPPGLVVQTYSGLKFLFLSRNSLSLMSISTLKLISPSFFLPSSDESLTYCFPAKLVLSILAMSLWLRADINLRRYSSSA